MVNNMVSFFDFLMPENSGIDAVALDRARSAGLLNAANNLATLSAPGFNKAAPTSLQLITGGLTGFQGGAQNSIDQFYTNEVNKSKAAQAGLDTKYASKAGQLMDMINADGSLPVGMATTPPASTPPSLSSFYGSPTQGVGSKPINNPGNLRPVGASTGFRQFSTPEDGMKALTDDLTAKLSGNSQAMAGRTPTLRNLISVYSPSNENATQQLIANAATRTGLSHDQPLTIADLPKVQQAIITQEQGGTGLNAGASGVPSPAGVQQPSSNVGDAYLSNQIRTLGMLQAAAGKPNAANMLEMGLQLDPRFSFMRNKNMPAVMQIADAMSNAQKNGNKQYLDNLIAAGKFYEKGMVSDGQGGVVAQPNYLDTASAINAAKNRAEASGKILGESDARLNSMQASMPQLETTVAKLSELGKKATYTYPGQIKDIISRQIPASVGGGATEGSIARTEYQNTVRDVLLPTLRQTFGAQFTVAEGEKLEQTLGDPNKTPEEKDAALRAFIEQKHLTIDSLRRETGGASAPASNNQQPKFLEFE